MKVRDIRTMAIALLSLGFISSASGDPITSFTVVDSSPTSWVARGFQDYTVTPELGWTFMPSRNFDDGIGFDITGPALPGTNVNNWFLNFAAPFDAQLAPGLYSDFQRWPFQDADRPGLEFGSTGRLDNRASGSFEILEVTYGPTGDVLTFAANFTHYGEEDPDNYAIVEIRFNASVIPEPGTLALSAIGLVGMAVLARSRGRDSLA